MRWRHWIVWVVLAWPLGLPGVGLAQVDDAPSLAGVIDTAEPSPGDIAALGEEVRLNDQTQVVVRARACVVLRSV